MRTDVKRKDDKLIKTAGSINDPTFLCVSIGDRIEEDETLSGTSIGRIRDIPMSFVRMAKMRKDLKN